MKAVIFVSFIVRVGGTASCLEGAHEVQKLRLEDLSQGRCSRSKVYIYISLEGGKEMKTKREVRELRMKKEDRGEIYREDGQGKRWHLHQVKVVVMETKGEVKGKQGEVCQTKVRE